MQDARASVHRHALRSARRRIPGKSLPNLPKCRPFLSGSRTLENAKYPKPFLSFVRKLRPVRERQRPRWHVPEFLILLISMSFEGHTGLHHTQSRWILCLTTQSDRASVSPRETEGGEGTGTRPVCTADNDRGRTRSEQLKVNRRWNKETRSSGL